MQTTGEARTGLEAAQCLVHLEHGQGACPGGAGCDCKMAAGRGKKHYSLQSKVL